MKRCTKCGDEKPLDCFYRDRGKPTPACKECKKAQLYAKRDEDRDAFRAYQRAWHAKHRERVNAKDRARWQLRKDAENERRREDRKVNPEKYRASQRASWARRADQISAARRAAWAANPEKFREEQRARRRANPDYFRKRDRAYRAHPDARARQRRYSKRYYRANTDRWEKNRAAYRARKNGVPHEPYTRREIWNRDGGECQGCAKKVPYKKGAFQIDHIVPISKGGPDTPANVQVLCGSCNREKWARLDWVPAKPKLF